MTFDLPDETDPSNVISLEAVSAEWERRRKANACLHRRITIDPTAIVVECRDCHERLATNAWLVDNLHMWHRVRNTYERTREAQERLKKHVRVRCQHCAKLTGVTRDERFQIVREAGTT